MRSWKAWSPEDRAVLRRDYPHRPTSAIAAALGCTIEHVYAKANELGLRKSAAATALSSRRRSRASPTRHCRRESPGGVCIDSSEPPERDGAAMKALLIGGERDGEWIDVAGETILEAPNAVTFKRRRDVIEHTEITAPIKAPRVVYLRGQLVDMHGRAHAIYTCHDNLQDAAFDPVRELLAGYRQPIP